MQENKKLKGRNIKKKRQKGEKETGKILLVHIILIILGIHIKKNILHWPVE